MDRKGRLLLVGTPLGNREDLSPRARRALEEADVLFCEDTRSVTRLLGPEVSLPPRHSCFAANEESRVPLLLRLLEEGSTVVLISEAGMPVWSDPGRIFVEAAVEGGFEVDVVPGPTAAATALCHSGFSARGAQFLGFPPRDGGPRREFLARVALAQGVSIVYESGNRTPDFLVDLVKEIEDAATRRVVVTRELTKLHQEVLRGTAAGLAETVREPLRGEVTLVIESCPTSVLDQAQVAARATLEILLGSDRKPREKAKELARLTGLDANVLYQRLGERRP